VYNHFLVATCGTPSRHGTIGADVNHYARWSEAYPLTEEDIEKLCKRKPREQEILIAGMLTKSHLLDLLKNYVIYEVQNNKRIKKIAKHSQILKPTFQHGSTLPYLGRSYPLHIMNNQKTGEKINFVNGQFLVHINGFKSSKKKIKSLYEKWLVQATMPSIERKIELYSKELEVTPQRLKLKKLRSRWGSTTVDRAIHLNTDLLKAPNEIIDYMILHELCHLRIRGHSHRYWDLVHNLCLITKIK
jgi:predicted metal-dependent hydrolase